MNTETQAKNVVSRECELEMRSAHRGEVASNRCEVKEVSLLALGQAQCARRTALERR